MILCGSKIYKIRRKVQFVLRVSKYENSLKQHLLREKEINKLIFVLSSR